jgi:hypothetical protein
VKLREGRAMDFDVYISKYADREGFLLTMKILPSKMRTVRIHFASLSGLCDALIAADLPPSTIKEVRSMSGHAYSPIEGWNISDEDLHRLVTHPQGQSLPPS